MQRKTGKNSRVDSGDSLNGRRLQRSAVVGLVAGVVALAGISLWIMPRARAAFGPEGSVSPKPLSTASTTKLPVIFLTATPFGFDQSRVQVPAGQYLLIVSNRSGITDVPLDFTISTVPGSETLITRSVESRGDYVEVMDFTPGEYSLTSPAQSQWQVQIVVQ